MRYAYWRRPDGSLHKQDDDRHAPAALLAEIGKTAKVNGDRVSWPMSGLHQYQTAAFPSIAIIGPDERELNEADTVGLVYDAVVETIKESGGGNPVLPLPLLRKVEKKAAALYRQRRQKRLLITSVSIERIPSAPIGTIDGCQITLVDRRQFPYPQPLVSSESYVRSHVMRTRYQAVAVSTDQVTLNQAFDIGMTALNYIRGTWNLIATFQSTSIDWSLVPCRKWIGAIHLGPVHTLHNADGTACADVYWCEPDYVDDAETFVPREGWDEFERKRREICDHIDGLPYKQELTKLIARYAIALDQANLDVAFLMLWSLLEKITDTVGDNYDETIKRAIWTYKERDIAKQLLTQMRWRRNQFVHSAGSSANRDQLCYITKSFVDGHLRSLIFNAFKIESLGEYGEFLALPHNEHRLKKVRDWYHQAYELRTAETNAEATNEAKDFQAGGLSNAAEATRCEPE